MSEKAEVITHYLYGNVLTSTSSYLTQLSDGDYIATGYEEYPVGLFVRYTLTPGTDVNPKNKSIPEKVALSQNYPNPFNPSTVITYSLPRKSNVNLKIYNALGEEVSILVSQNQNAGNYEVTFNASNLPSGIYFYSIQTDEFVSVKKMILIK